MMKVNQLRDNPGARYKSKALGRGIGSGKGKTSGRGGKGQTARSGVAIKGFEGGQTPIHRRLPKRGFNNVNRKEVGIVNFKDLARLIECKMIVEGDTIDRMKLVEVGIFANANKPVKLLANGEFSGKFKFDLDNYSATAKAKLLAAGCEILAE